MIPADPGTRIAVVRKEGEKLVSVGLRTPATAGTLLSKYRLFVGPKEYDTLAALKLELEETIDFGWFIYGSWSIVRAVAKPLFYAIRYLHEITHNYGVAIILITVFIKLLLAPLAYKSYKSMKDMAAVQPEMMALQKKYADDRERLRSEEHTSELQSQSNLVCRLLLEKKKKKRIVLPQTASKCLMH